jgi:hypothetical protein
MDGQVFGNLQLKVGSALLEIHDSRLSKRGVADLDECLQAFRDDRFEGGEPREFDQR